LIDDVLRFNLNGIFSRFITNINISPCFVKGIFKQPLSLENSAAKIKVKK